MQQKPIRRKRVAPWAGGFLIMGLILLAGVGEAREMDPMVSKQLAAYQRAYDKAFSDNQSQFEEWIANPTGYYIVNSPIGSSLSMYEATKDPKYLERALKWAQIMIANATIVDNNGDRNWPGTWPYCSTCTVSTLHQSYSPTPIAYEQEELEGPVELARLARMILTDPTLKATYGSQATAIYNFVKDHIVQKHLCHREYLTSYYLKNADPDQDPGEMESGVVLMMRDLRDLYLVDRNVGCVDKKSTYHKYGEVVNALARSYKKRFTPYKGALLWDKGKSWYRRGYTAIDTSHADVYPAAVIDLYKAGIVFTLEDVKGLAALLTKVIWNQSYEDPRFTNLIDGSNPTFYNCDVEAQCDPPYEPWAAGAMGGGWAALGEFDPQAQRVVDAVFKAIVAGKHNPSLNNTGNVYGQLELPAQLAKNLALSWARQTGSEPAKAVIPGRASSRRHTHGKPR